MNQKKPWTILFLMLLLPCVCAHAQANEVSITLQSSEVIRGKLISEANGVVEFKRAILGDLKINRALITNIASVPQSELKPSESASAASHTHTLSGPIEKKCNRYQSTQHGFIKCRYLL